MLIPKPVYPLVCSLLLLLGPLAARAAEPSGPAPEEIWRQIEAAPKRGLLYEVKKGKNVGHVFGTIHVGTPDFYPLNLPVTHALTQAKYLAVEANILDPMAVAKSVTEFAVYAAPASLDQHIPAALLRRVETLLEKYNFPKDQAMQLKPWMLAMTLSAFEAIQAGYHPNWSVDVYLLSFARSQNKAVVELEGFGPQFKIFNDLAPAQQVAFLDDTLRSLERGEARKEIAALVDAWVNADAGALADEWTRALERQSASE